MHTQLATAVLLVLVATVTGQQNRVPPAIQKLRAPLTAIPLKDIFANMNNPNTVTFYTNCVSGDGTCDRVGAALRHLLRDVRPGQEMCFGCSPCERERVQYALDTMLEKYPKHACKVQTALQLPIFGRTLQC